MKVLIPCILSSFLLLLNITAAGSDILADSKWISFQKQQWKSNDSIRITAAQNSYFTSDHTMTFWGLLEVEDIETLAAHNHTQQIEFKQSWSKGDLSDTDWQYFEMFFARYLYNFQDHVINITEKAGVTGAMMFQCWTGCSSSLDDMESFTYRVAMNGEDLVALNIAEEVWVAGNAPHSQAIQRIMQSYRLTTVSIKNILIHQCHLLALSYLNVGKEAFAKKIQPQVYIIKKPQKSETEVICMVTGFYPKPINVSLWKENKMEDVISTDTLPNGDGTYQIRVTANVNVNDQGSVYCQVEHSSLKSPLIVYQDKTHHNLIGMSIGIMAAIAVCVVGMTFLVKSYKKRRRYTSITAFPMDRLREQEQWLNCARQKKNLTQVHSNTNIL